MAKKKRERKGILKSLLNLVSSKDEKEEAAKLQAEVEAAEKEAEKSNEQKAIEALKHADMRLEKYEEGVREKRVEDWRAKFREAREAKKDVVIMKEHKVGEGETLSHVALKYYGFATEPYWRVIFEANHDVMGDNEKRMYPGLVLKIPELPAELRDEE